MQETSIVPMKIPEHAKLIAEAEEKSRNFSSSYDTKTSTWVRWTTGIQTGMATSVVFDFLPTSGFETASTIGYVCTGLATVTAVIGMMIEYKSISAITRGIKEMKEVPNYAEWETESLQRDPLGGWNSKPVSSKGYRVRKATTKSVLPHFFNPQRMFGGAILSETLWYNPVTDIYTLETENLRMLNWWTTTEQYAGRRKTMSDALDAL